MPQGRRVVAADGGEDAEVLFDPAAQAWIGPAERERALEVLLGAPHRAVLDLIPTQRVQRLGCQP